MCRRLSGAQLEPGQCLDLICGEFLATYAYLAHQEEIKAEEPDEENTAEVENDAATERIELAICLENDGPPSTPRCELRQDLARGVGAGPLPL